MLSPPTQQRWMQTRVATPPTPNTLALLRILCSTPETLAKLTDIRNYLREVRVYLDDRDTEPQWDLTDIDTLAVELTLRFSKRGTWQMSVEFCPLSFEAGQRYRHYYPLRTRTELPVTPFPYGLPNTTPELQAFTARPDLLFLDQSAGSTCDITQLQRIEQYGFDSIGVGTRDLAYARARRRVVLVQSLPVAELLGACLEPSEFSIDSSVIWDYCRYVNNPSGITVEVPRLHLDTDASAYALRYWTKGGFHMDIVEFIRWYLAHGVQLRYRLL